MSKNDPTPSSPKLHNDRLTEEQVREKLRNERNVEHIYIYKNNQQIARFKGYKGYNVVNVPEEWLVRMKDATVYHNHLNGSSFSFEDIELVVDKDAKEFVVCSQKFDYIVQRPLEGWGFTLKVGENDITLDADSLGVIRQCMILADQQLHDVRQGYINDSDKEDFRMHYIWSAFFHLKDIYYKQIHNK